MSYHFHRYKCRKCREDVCVGDGRHFKQFMKHPFPEPYVKEQLCEDCFREDHPRRPALREEIWKNDCKTYGWKDNGHASMKKPCPTCNGEGEDSKGYLCSYCNGEKIITHSFNNEWGQQGFEGWDD